MPIAGSTDPDAHKFKKFAQIAFAALLCLTIGGILGWLVGSTMNYLTQDEKQMLTISTQLVQDRFDEGPQGILNQIINAVNATKIKEYLKVFSSHPHLGGTEGEEQLAIFIRDKWIAQGLDDVQMVPYEVLLSYADENRPNTVELLGEFEDVLYRNSYPPLPSGDDWSAFSKYPFPYFAYAPNGTIVGDPVFVNYGEEEDYTYLLEIGINISGNIAIAKAGRENVGTKLSLAEKYGAIGLLIYADPPVVALDGANQNLVYPHTWWLPSTGSIRSTVRNNLGDPLTPGYPSIENAFRIPVNNVEFHKIPAQPISAKDAREIIGRMGGLDVPEYWNGSMDIPYRLGPGFSEGFKSLKLRMSVYNQLKMATTYNVIGTIIGEEEPDRYVLMGNHRDAWVKGVVDPGSGSAVMMELTRTLGKIHKNGWKPRRTLMFCSWGSEEFGLIGSMEWVEEHLLTLQERSVAYINVDTCIAGDTFNPQISAVIQHAAFKIAKLVTNPDNSDESLYDSWYRKMKEEDRIDSSDDIMINALYLSSDFAPFIFYAGIPVMDMFWEKTEGKGIGPYPVYHTEFETIYYSEKFLDNDYRRHASCTQFTGAMMHYLADSALLPYDFKMFVKNEQKTFSLLTNLELEFEERNISLYPLQTALHNLSHAAIIWESYLEKANKQNPYILRSLNDHMMLMHKSFLNSVTTNESFAWLYRYGTEESVSFVYDAVHAEDKNNWLVIQQHLSNLLIMVQKLVGMLSKNHYSL